MTLPVESDKGDLSVTILQTLTLPHPDRNFGPPAAIQDPKR
jgi:hypothetical protein